MSADKEFLTNFFGRMNEMRHTNSLIDFTIILKGKEYPVHKLMVATSSKYFNTYFLANKEETSLEIDFVSPQTLDILLDYCYSGEITITADNVEPVLAGAQILQVVSVIESSYIFLHESSDPAHRRLIDKYNIDYDHAAEMIKLYTAEEPCRYPGVGRYVFVRHSADFLLRALRERRFTGDMYSIGYALTEWAVYDKPGVLAEDRRSRVAELFGELLPWTVRQQNISRPEPVDTGDDRLDALLKMFLVKAAVARAREVQEFAWDCNVTTLEEIKIED